MHYGKNNSAEFKKVYVKIREASESGKIILPVSLFHLEEIMIRMNKPQRIKLIEFMTMISQGWSLKPYVFFVWKEIENAVFRNLGKQPLYDIHSEIIGRGLTDLMGSKFKLVPKNPSVPVSKEKLEKLTELVKSPEIMARLLGIDPASDEFKKMRKDTIETAEVMEEIRIEKSFIKDRDRRYREAAVQYFADIIVPVLARMPSKYGIPKEVIMPIGREALERFLEDMPSTNVAFRLVNSRDLLERPIKTSDIGDINHLAGAIPYCDIVVFEKMFSNLAIQNKLDKKYDCIILSSLEALSKCI